MEGPMAKAEQHTPAELKLGVLLRYLMQRLRWREDFALYAIDQRIAAGDLPLKVRHYLDEKFQGESFVAPGYYRNYLGLEIRDGRVHVISKYFALVPGEFRYTVLKQDAQFVDWSAQSSQNADLVAEPSASASAPAESNEATVSKTWIQNELIGLLKIKGKDGIPADISRTKLAQLLSDRMHTAKETTNKFLSPVGQEYIYNNLPSWGLWPLERIKIS
jgi:hypothetical protein